MPTFKLQAGRSWSHGPPAISCLCGRGNRTEHIKHPDAGTTTGGEIDSFHVCFKCARELEKEMRDELEAAEFD